MRERPTIAAATIIPIGSIPPSTTSLLPVVEKERAKVKVKARAKVKARVRAKAKAKARAKMKCDAVAGAAAARLAVHDASVRDDSGVARCLPTVISTSAVRLRRGRSCLTWMVPASTAPSFSAARCSR